LAADLESPAARHAGGVLSGAGIEELTLAKLTQAPGMPAYQHQPFRDFTPFINALASRNYSGIPGRIARRKH